MLCLYLEYDYLQDGMKISKFKNEIEKNQVMSQIVADAEYIKNIRLQNKKQTQKEKLEVILSFKNALEKTQNKAIWRAEEKGFRIT